MAAPAGRYSNNTLNDKNGGNSKRIYALLPLALSEYVSDAGFKSKFFVHETWYLKDSENKQCVIGLLRADVNQTYNKLHNVARYGKLRLLKGGVEYIVLNDGGLNTMAYCKIKSNTPSKCYTNYIKVIAELQSAQYAKTHSFEVKISKEGQEIYSFYLVNESASGEDKRIFPAGYFAPEFVGKYREPIGGLAEGDTITLTITSSNAEGEYTCDSVDMEVQGAMEFIQVYYFPTQPDFDATDPTTGVPYAMLISEDMYKAGDPLQIGSGGVLWRLFQAQGDPITVQDSERLQGAQGTPEDAYETPLANLPDGYYYGVPYEDFAGTDGYLYVRVAGNRLYRYYNRYQPVVPTAYTVTMSFVATYDTTFRKYSIDVYAKIEGARPYRGVTVTTTVCMGVDRHGNPIDVQFGGPISKTVNTGGLVKINDTPIVRDAGAHFQTFNTSGRPISTIDNYVTEGIIHT